MAYRRAFCSLMIISHSNIAEIINKARRDPTESARKKAHWCRGARAEQYCGTSPSDKRQLQTPAWRKHLQRLEQQRRQQCRRRPKCRTEHRLPVLLRGNRGNGADLLSWTTVLGEAGQVCEVSNLRPARNWLFCFQRVGVCGSSAVQCRQHCRYMPVSCCRSCAYLDKFSDEELLFAIRFITMREFEFSKNKIQTRTICRIRHYVFASQKVTAKSNDFCTGVTRKCNALPLLVTSQKL